MDQSQALLRAVVESGDVDMVLTIDQNKVDEQLANTVAAYTVTLRNLNVSAVPPAEPPPTQVYGTVAGFPADFERARARLVALRQRVIQGGAPMLSGDDLDRYIEETLGR